MSMLNTGGNGKGDVSKNYVDSELSKKVNNDELDNYITFSVDRSKDAHIPTGIRVINEIDSKYLTSGTTGERPTICNIGQMYFDTDLNRPIWRNSHNDGWVDSNGIDV